MNAGGVVIVGVCRYCGCTDLKPCMNDDTRLPCGWIDEAHTICDNVQCIARVPLAELEIYLREN